MIPVNKIGEYIKNTNCPIVFDMDGTLTSYNYGTYNAFHDKDHAGNAGSIEYLNEHIYKSIVKPIPVIADFLKAKDMKNIFVLSKETHGQEADKRWFAQKYYGILPEQCFFTSSPEDKIDVLNKVLPKYFVTNNTPVYIDDYAEFLSDVRDKTKYYTAHVTIFFE